MSIKTVGELRTMLEEALESLEGLSDSQEIRATLIAPKSDYSADVEGCYLQGLSFEADSFEADLDEKEAGVYMTMHIQ